MADITEDDFNHVMEKLVHIFENYEVNFRELSFLKAEIESLTITDITRLEYLQKIVAWTYEIAPRSYVIRFIHHRLVEDIEDLEGGRYDKYKYPAYLEFGYRA